MLDGGLLKFAVVATGRKNPVHKLECQIGFSGAP